jgi:hypothetical protein
MPPYTPTSTNNAHQKEVQLLHVSVYHISYREILTGEVFAIPSLFEKAGE